MRSVNQSINQNLQTLMGEFGVHDGSVHGSSKSTETSPTQKSTNHFQPNYLNELSGWESNKVNTSTCSFVEVRAQLRKYDGQR